MFISKYWAAKKRNHKVVKLDQNAEGTIRDISDFENIKDRVTLNRLIDPTQADLLVRSTDLLRQITQFICSNIIHGSNDSIIAVETLKRVRA